MLLFLLLHWSTWTDCEKSKRCILSFHSYAWPNPSATTFTACMKWFRMVSCQNFLLHSLDWVAVFLLSSVTHERQWHKHYERFYTYICTLKTIHTVMRDKTLLSSRDRSFCKSSWHQGSPSIQIQQGLRSCNRRRPTVLGRLVAAAVFVILEMFPLLLAGNPKANDWATIRRRFKRRSRSNFLSPLQTGILCKEMFPKLSQHHKKANASFLSIVVESFLHLQNCKQFDVMFYQTMKKVVLSGVSKCWKQ